MSTDRSRPRTVEEHLAAGGRMATMEEAEQQLIADGVLSPDDSPGASAVHLMAALAAQNAADLAYTTNSLIDGLNDDVMKATSLGLELVDLLWEITGGRMTPGEHAQVENIQYLLHQMNLHANDRTPMKEKNR